MISRDIVVKMKVVFNFDYKEHIQTELISSQLEIISFFSEIWPKWHFESQYSSLHENIGLKK